MQQLLILGSLPEPIGGVSVYCKRLCEELKYKNVEFQFVDINKSSFSKIISSVFKFNVIHLNTSNPFFRIIIVILSKLLLKKIIITFHGNIGRFNWFKNILDSFSIILCTAPVVINNGSYVKAIKLNSQTKLSSAFFRPRNITPLPNPLLLKISKLKNESTHLFCTNAFNITYDKKGRETYQISQIISVFSQLKNQSLVFSDPSRQYSKYLKSKNIIIPTNIIIIDEPHDFNAVLKEVDAFIRYTTTDGDSISVKEALSLGKSVIASDVVSRPKEVTTVNNLNTLKKEIENFQFKKIKLDYSSQNIDILLQLFSK